MSPAAVMPLTLPDDPAVPDPVAAVMERARAAQRLFAEVDQSQADAAVRALAWSLYKPEHAREVAELEGPLEGGMGIQRPTAGYQLLLQEATVSL